jgi:cell filamentation protein
MMVRVPPDESDVPENRFGITDLAELQKLETALALRRLLELQFTPVAGHFDTGHLCAIHRYIFQDVYAWAGELRTVNISKGGAAFPPPQYLQRSLDALFAELSSENSLRALPTQSWARRAAYFLGEINAIHPFREGNGRTQREFIRELALAAGHRLSWAQLTPQEVIHAAQVSFVRRDYSGLEKMLLFALKGYE